MHVAKDIFLQRMADWLERKEYVVGIDGRAVNVNKSIWGVRLAGAAVKLAFHLPHYARVRVSGGATAEQARLALAPFSPLVDLLGWRHATATKGNTLVLVICADELAPQVLLERFDSFLSLAGP